MLLTTTATDIQPAVIGFKTVLRGRFIGTCGKCKMTSAIDAVTAVARVNGRRVAGWATDAGDFVAMNDSSRAACACGRSVYGVELRIVQGRFSPDHKCGARCRNSKGHTCDCSCGGANHGQGFCA